MMIRKYRGEMRYIVGRMKRHENLKCISKEGKHDECQDADKEAERHKAIRKEDESKRRDVLREDNWMKAKSKQISLKRSMVICSANGNRKILCAFIKILSLLIFMEEDVFIFFIFSDLRKGFAFLVR